MECFAETPDGLLLVANGHDPMLRWDSLTSHMETAGVAPPIATPTLTGSGNGGIVGTYYAFLRFVDRLGNVSNLSPISLEYATAGTTGDISGATNATPIVITTSGDHGLTNGVTVKISGVGGNDAANDTWTITVLSSTTFSLDTSSGDGDYDGGGTWARGVLTLTFGNLETPSDPKITRRQILRNTDGQADTFYVDVDTTDLSSSSLTSTREDSDLSTQEAVPLLDSDGNTFANRYTVPPSHKAVIAHHRGRMFAAVDREYNHGHVKVTFGSATVYGIGTDFTTSMAGRAFYLVGATKSYEISAVNTSTQTLTLTENYQDDTDLFATYSIRPFPAERRLIYYSESDLPQAWPATNAIALQEDGDEITGLMPKGPFLYVLERRHVYRFTYNSDPETDGAVFLAGNRGCVNQRCWLIVDNAGFMLDEEGIHRFGGDEGSEAVSVAIADLFSPGTGGEFRVNWQARDNFHALLFSADQTMRWFVCLDGNWLPKHAICYNYRDNRWWLEAFHCPIACSASGELARTPQMYLGSEHRRFLAYGIGALDGPDATAGTLRGTVTSAGPVTLGDTLAAFASWMANMPLSVVGGPGKGQIRKIVAVSGTTLTIDQPWLILPDTTSTYQIGGIHWKWRSGWYRFAQAETQNTRRLEVVFQPLERPATFDLRIRVDFSEDALEWGTTMDSDQGAGVASVENSADLVCDFTKSYGLVQKRLDGHKEYFLDGKRFTQTELEGFSNGEQAKIWEVTYDGVVEAGGERRRG